MKGKLLLDIGNVIINRKNPGGENSYSTGDYRLSPQIPGAFRGIGHLVKQGYEIFFASVAQDEYQGKDRGWFIHNRFEFMTGASLDDEHLLYRTERGQKAIVAYNLAITDVIDDRFEVMLCFSRIPSIQRFYLLNPNEKNAYECRDRLPHIPIVRTWDNFLRDHLFSRSRIFPEIPVTPPGISP
jgi:hypothetical protein